MDTFAILTEAIRRLISTSTLTSTLAIMQQIKHSEHALIATILFQEQLISVGIATAASEYLISKAY